MKSFWLVLICISFSVFSSKILAATDTITHLQSLSEGQTLISRNGSFELGFFHPGNSENSYLGIWYKNIPVKTIVWVANREAPVKNISGRLILNKTGDMVLLNHNKTVLWQIIPRRKAQNPVLQILDSGNLVLSEEGDEYPENYLWQSFDYPSDTLLPGMKLGKDLRTGLDRRLTAWKNENDPSPGSLTWSMDVTNYPEPMLRIGSEKYFNTSPWNGLLYSGKPTLKPHPIFDFTCFSDENEVYFMFLLVNKSIKARMVLNQTILVRQQLAWTEVEQRWKIYASLPMDFCDKFGACGPNGNCDEDKSPFCECLKGFKPKSPSNWVEMNCTEGCVRDEPLNCQDDGFVKYIKMKVPDTEYSLLMNQSMTLMECREECLKSCSCMAYTNSDIRGAGSGCAMWFGDLNDLRVQPDAGQDLYVRVPSSVLETTDKRKMKIGIAVGSVIAIIIGSFLAFYFMCRRRRRITANNKTENESIIDQSNGEEKEDLELPLFDLSKTATATGNFSSNNKLGEGGFGPVYKGTLDDGQEIAVKRLSRTSGQGLDELKNEVILIAKLQHRNLVKLLGCSIQNEEKLLAYEYMPNKSLDCFIFDQMQKYLLDWSKRFQIICGIARSIFYLHQDSRLRIIYRDLKASNVFLDNEMNPKISDFGLARILGGDQSAENTCRVVGTYGYMALECAIDGKFSVKSDVYSFGVLLLEIVSGKKNREKFRPNESLNLIGYAWDLWIEERPEELIDECFKNSCNLSDVVRCIHISLLCLQQHPHDRPSMSSVVMMLNSETALPQPKQPGFFVGECSHDEYSSLYKHELASVNQLSITVLEARWE